MASAQHDKASAISRNRPNPTAAKAAGEEGGVEQAGPAGRSAVEQTSRHAGANADRAKTSGVETQTRQAGLRDEERTTGNDRELAANNAPERSSAEQPGKPASLGGIRQD
ncbi:MAG: hypothetical protein WDN72_10990 [Alphaproteobacteria bacterium]